MLCWCSRFQQLCHTTWSIHQSGGSVVFLVLLLGILEKEHFAAGLTIDCPVADPLSTVGLDREKVAPCEDVRALALVTGKSELLGHRSRQYLLRRSGLCFLDGVFYFELRAYLSAQLSGDWRFEHF